MATITLARIDQKIGTFTTNRKALAGLGHEVAMMIFMHAAPKEVSSDCNGTGDCTRALSLTAQMPKSWAGQMEDWFKAYTPIRVVTKNKKCEYDPAYKKLTAEEKLTWWKLEDANLNPFHEIEEQGPADAKILTFEQLLILVEGMAKRIEKQAEEGKISADDVESAKAMAAKLRGTKFNRVKPANDEGTTTTEEANAA